MGSSWVACDSNGSDLDPSAPDVESAQFGIFFGGQIQARREIPFNLNAAKQRLGFRILFSEPPRVDTAIHWELTKPGPPTGPEKLAKPGQRVTQLGQATIPRGSTRFDQDLSFAPGDPLGLWNLRVTLGNRVLIDRPFSVYDADARRAARRTLRKADAGL